MRATLNSGSSHKLFLGVLALLLSIAHANAFNPTNFLAQAQAAFHTAEKAWQTNAANFDANINFSRAAFDLAEFAPDNTERERLAHIGIRCARAAIERHRERVEGHYYLGLNLGQLARTKMLGALKILNEMEAEWIAAREVDSKFDHGGPDRSLGILYMEAPGWPTSVGNKNKASKHLELAVSIDPKYPDNLISLMEAYVKWKDWPNLDKRMKEFEKLLPEARKNFAGPDWANEWADWETRWQTIQTKARKQR